MDDPNELAKSVITGAISETAAKVLETDVSRHLLDPAASEVGKLMGEIASVARFYATDNMARIFKRWAESRNGRPVVEVEFKRVLPLLPTASLVSDEELQELWARLLEATAQTESNVLPSFGQTLAQLTRSEAKFLIAAWNQRIFEQTVSALTWLCLRCLSGDIDDDGQYNGIIRDYSPFLRIEADVMVSDVMRLGILQRTGGFSKNDQKLEERVAFSGYGRRFMRVVMGQLWKEDED